MATPSRSEAPAATSPAAAISPTVASVGFVGLGDMGGAMARRIVDAGWPVHLWARRPEVLAVFDAANVERAATPAALAAACDLVGVCVWSDEDVRAVVAGDEGLLTGCRPGTVVAIHATVSPSTVRELAVLAAARGAVVLDAPVTGGREVALAGALTVAAGGDEATLARCLPVFDAFAGSVVHVGDVGAGQLAKLVNNALLAANLAVADDALALGEALGVGPAGLVPFLRAGSGRSYGLDVALTVRGSAAARAATRPALDKDVRGLTAEMPTGGPAGTLLTGTAQEALRRLAGPPTARPLVEEP